MLEAIVAEMKTEAAKSKIDLAKGAPNPCAGIIKTLAIDDIMVRIMLTCDIFPGNKELWHLSISAMPYGPTPENVIKTVRDAFFADTESIEMPPLFGGVVKQYLGKVT